MANGSNRKGLLLSVTATIYKLSELLKLSNVSSLFVIQKAIHVYNSQSLSDSLK